MKRISLGFVLSGVTLLTGLIALRLIEARRPGAPVPARHRRKGGEAPRGGTIETAARE